VLDTSCGYGSFLRGAQTIGGDIDTHALKQAALDSPHSALFNYNGLLDVSREKYRIRNGDKVIVVGNPPYNDRTSLIRHGIKSGHCAIDRDLVRRDIGLSFLLSYDKLQADYICVLHPLSYLIKKANFNALTPFTSNYLLLDSLVVPSGEFSQASKTTQFPIIIALYGRVRSSGRPAPGMDYGFIENYVFKTIEGKEWSLRQLNSTSIDKYIPKYPNRAKVPLEETITFFWTLRDINALKRTKTFSDTESSNTVRVTDDTFDYYCYVDIFKDYIKHIPYYWGNCNVIIDHEGFTKIKDTFRQSACS
jgi:hypothetical protein